MRILLVAPLFAAPLKAIPQAYMAGNEAAPSWLAQSYEYAKNTAYYGADRLALSLGVSLTTLGRETLIRKTSEALEASVKNSTDQTSHKSYAALATKITSSISMHYLFDMALRSSLVYWNAQEPIALLDALSAGYGATGFYDYNAQTLTALGTMSIFRALMLGSIHGPSEIMPITSASLNWGAKLISLLSMHRCLSKELLIKNDLSFESVVHNASYRPLTTLYVLGMHSIVQACVPLIYNEAKQALHAFRFMSDAPKEEDEPSAKAAHAIKTA
jgi:hypothetical protein